MRRMCGAKLENCPESELEITPEMIEAAMTDLFLYDPLVDSPRQTAEAMLRSAWANRPARHLPG
jgi:hypothetical protein